MALVKPDLSEHTETLTLAPGTYKVRVTGCEQKTSVKGSDYLNWKMEVFGAEKAAYNGKWVFMMTPLSGKGVFRLVELYSAATKEKLNPKTPEFDTEQIIGKEVEVTLAEARDQDGNIRKYPDVKSVRALQ